MSDIVLIAAGIGGFGALVSAHPGAMNVARFGGAAFLIGYGLLAARRAYRPAALTPSDAAPARLAEVLVTCAALTFLNPHVYLDTVVLLGALANEHRDEPLAVRRRGGHGQRSLVRQPRTRRAPPGRPLRHPADLALPRRLHRRHDDRPRVPRWC